MTEELSWRVFWGLYSGETAETSVNRYDSTGDERCFLACEETDDAVELADVAEASHWGLVEHLVTAFGETAVIVEECLAVLLADEESWGDGVDAYLVAILACEVLGKPLGEGIDSFLGYAVTHDAAEGVVGCHGTDVDDGTALLLSHDLAEREAWIYCTPEVEVDNLLEGFHIALVDVHIVHDVGSCYIAACCVDEDVDTLELVFHLLCEGCDIVVVEHVAHESGDCGSVCLCYRCQLGKCLVDCLQTAAYNDDCGMCLE